MPRTQGVYTITNVRTAEVYVGSSIDIARRWSDHRRELLTKRHKNALLQTAYDRDGVDAFAIGILELVGEVELLTVREQHFLDLLKPAYNDGKIAVRAPYRTWRSDEADQKRFWSKVDQTGEGCWLWQGTMLRQGYGCFKIAGKMYKAHRVAYTFAKEVIPLGLFVCHHCDNPRCVRPDHLFIGTLKDNTADMLAKGRGFVTRPENKKRKVPPERHGSRLHPERYRGELNGRAILDRKQVEEIRARYAAGGVSQFVLSDEYHVAQTTISAIVRGLRWKD